MTSKTQAILSSAYSWIGTPYCHQASKKNVGADCLGLIQGVWQEALGEAPNETQKYSSHWAEIGGSEEFAHAARKYMIEKAIIDASPSDVLLFRWHPNAPAKHAGILDKDGYFIHAYDRSSVTRTRLSKWWQKRIAYVFSFPNKNTSINKG
jgi:NlpC/P60 family putative phage cell wall peptidase